MSEFEPQIVAFFCNWCTFTAADLAGTSRLSYPANLKIIRVMCTGMVDPKYVLKAFLNGADGVLIGGCWPWTQPHSEYRSNGSLKTWEMTENG
jgi:F420-non-reducing hydrogenase iron-sulfur subunit